MDPEHLDQIGWVITSFFLVFLGTIFSNFISWYNNPDSIDNFLVMLTIFSTMFFSYIVTRLFLKSQYNSKKEDLRRRLQQQINRTEFWKNPSILFYIMFILLINIFLLIVLLRFIPLAGIILIIIFFLMVIILDIIYHLNN